MRIDVLTLFPEIFAGYLTESLLGIAIRTGAVEVFLHDIREWAGNRHRSVDDRPFGGGPGMVLRVEPVVESVEAVLAADSRPGHLIALAPQGRQLTQSAVEELARCQRLLLLCGRYEGIDQRAFDILAPDAISIGPYVLNGGEVAAMVIIDAVIRLLPGVLGDERSPWQDSFSGPDRLLEHAQYTRPREFRGHAVPDVLLGGDHGEIAGWRHRQSLERTRLQSAGIGADGRIDSQEKP
jgi:tRNA (guanine37-N1)-methyltransferase